MMRSGLAHLWTTQEIYNICFKKLSATEKAAWQEVRGGQQPDKAPQEFVRDRKIPEPRE
jgi:hypothetical protein